MSVMTLEEKVRAVLFQDDNGNGPIGQCGDNPGGSWHLSEFERDMRDWGCVYGMAFGIARCEEPCESNEQVAARALGAAHHVYVEFAGILKTLGDAKGEVEDANKRHGIEDVTAAVESLRTAEAVA